MLFGCWLAANSPGLAQTQNDEIKAVDTPQETNTNAPDEDDVHLAPYPEAALSPEPPAAKVAPENRPENSQENKHEQYPWLFLSDGGAQWGMFVFSLLALLLSVYVACLLKQTLKVNRSMFASMRRADKAAWAGVRTNQKIGQEQTRAHVAITFIKVDDAFRSDGACTLSVGLLNGGATPSYRHFIKFRGYVWSGPRTKSEVIEIEDFHIGEDVRKFILPEAAKSLKHEAIVRGGEIDRILKEQMDNWISCGRCEQRKPEIQIIGELSYLDAFGDIHLVEFEYRFPEYLLASVGKVDSVDIVRIAKAEQWPNQPQD
tara:strand:- start:26642 stop:27589 length:948 start_codon:yes stop_codon:yes gene_type:complete